jgi:carbonic anhydrase
MSGQEHTMAFPEKLVAGYRTFLAGRLPTEQARFRELAERGQAPETMVIGCSDSRVAPEAIFDARPGELFVVRNVANLVPPYAPDSAYHGVSAALEFAVQVLRVKHIVVLAHARCGGIRAYAEPGAPLSPGDFIGRWMSLIAPTANALPRGADEPLAGYLTRLEHASLTKTLDNLLTFPCIRILAERGDLALHAAYFDVATGLLSVRDPQSGAFETVAAEEHRRAFSDPRF